MAQVVKMLVSRYSRLKKWDKKKDGTYAWRAFTAMRATGLAVEKAHVLRKQTSFGMVAVEDLKSVTVFGELQILEDKRWVAAGSCELQLQDREAQLAKLVFEKHTGLLDDLRLNIWKVDEPMPAGLGRFDLLADFSTTKNYGVFNRVWVEIKVFAASGYSKKVEDAQKHLETVLPKVQEQDDKIGAVVLLAAKVEALAGGVWGAPRLQALLHKADDDDWKTIGGGRLPGAGQCKGEKPGLAKVWPKMMWHQVPGGGRKKYGTFKHFLKEFRQGAGTPGRRAAGFNAKLQREGHAGRIFEADVGLPGRDPWVATKETYRAVYNFL